MSNSLTKQNSIYTGYSEHRIYKSIHPKSTHTSSSCLIRSRLWANLGSLSGSIGHRAGLHSGWDADPFTDRHTLSNLVTSSPNWVLFKKELELTRCEAGVSIVAKHRVALNKCKNSDLSSGANITYKSGTEMYLKNVSCSGYSSRKHSDNDKNLSIHITIKENLYFHHLMTAQRNFRFGPERQ